MVLNLYILYRVMSSLKFGGWLQGEVYYKVVRNAPCSKWRPYPGLQLKTFKTFILMVKPLKPLFFSEKPLKPFIFKKSCFSGENNSESVMLS